MLTKIIEAIFACTRN